jgi:hypothetical protein
MPMRRASPGRPGGTGPGLTSIGPPRQARSLTLHGAKPSRRLACRRGSRGRRAGEQRSRVGGRRVGTGRQRRAVTKRRWRCEEFKLEIRPQAGDEAGLNVPVVQKTNLLPCWDASSSGGDEIAAENVDEAFVDGCADVAVMSNKRYESASGRETRCMRSWTRDE